MDGLEFFEDGHIYKWNGTEVPSVSKILKTIGITRDYERCDPYYRERGTLVHQAVHYHVKGTLDEESIDQENVLPYLDGFRRFEKAQPYAAYHSEVPLYSERFGFAGTIDQIGSLDGSLGLGITDLKVTESSDKAADLQLCLYANLFFEKFHYWPEFRMVLELHGDGTTRPIFYKTNPKIVKSLMEIWKWKTTRRSQSITAKP